MLHNSRAITQDEYVLPDGEVLITQTDPQSRIVYANAAFLEASELSLEECLGQPQSLIRHPDMPEEAFTDLWNTMAEGVPWTGIIKNRRRSGGFYWVRVYVTPIVEAQALVGFMWVRVKPALEEVVVAERAYVAMRSGKGSMLRMVRGRVRDVSLKGRAASLAELTLGAGTHLMMGLIASLFTAVGVAQLLVPRALDAVAARYTVAACALGAVMAILNIFYVHQRLVRPIRTMARAANDLVAGDVRATFSTFGDAQLSSLGGSLQQLAAGVTGVLKETYLAVSGMNLAITGISEASGELASRTLETAAGLEQTAAAIDQLTSTVASNSQNARHANELASKASQITAAGGQLVGEVAQTMAGISTSSKEIAAIVGVIDEIAFQTNLLALNAAVEAARAGELGRGFAVVAQEVRSLALRSSKAAKDIHGLIAVSVEIVERGTNLATRAEQTMRDVVDSVKQVADIITEIETASREQGAGIELINQGAVQMEHFTQRNSEMAQSVTRTAHTLKQSSALVLQVVAGFSQQTGGIQIAASSSDVPSSAARTDTLMDDLRAA